MVLGGDDRDGVRELLARVVTAVKLDSGLILNTFDALERRELDGLRRDLAVPVRKFSPPGRRQQPAVAGPELPKVAGCVAATISAVRELRQPGLHEPAGPGGDGMGHRRQ